MAETAPIRPQRIVRTNRETTGGLLMSVIRSLTTSRDSADRDRERLELEKGFQQCELRLNELINQHGSDLYQVMATFSKILTNLSKSKERLIDTRDKLLNCQKLLHCKRDELKKLWLEMVENRAVYDLLEKIEQINSLPDQVETYADRKHYLHAAQCCVDGLRQLGQQQKGRVFGQDPMKWHANIHYNSGHDDHHPSADSVCNESLNQIEALGQVRSELFAKKETLFDKCIDELHRHLYSVATETIRKRFLQQHDENKHKDPSSDDGSIMVDGLAAGNELKKFTNSADDTAHNDIIDDEPGSYQTKACAINGSAFDAYPEEDSGQFIAMLTKCIGLLNKIPMAIKIIKQRFDEELVHLVIRTAQDILAHNDCLSPTSTTIGHHNDYGDQKFFNTINHSLPPFMLIDSDLLLAQGQANLLVLTCTRLLGHRYNAFSHLNAVDEQKAMEMQTPRTSIQLRQLFQMLMEQFNYVMQLHESIVLFNLKRIENGLHNQTQIDCNGFDSDSNSECTSFYTGMDIWCKIQLLVQQLLDYYLDVSQISGQSSGTGANAINYNLVSSLLPSTAINMLFGANLNPAQTVASVAGTGSMMMVPSNNVVGPYAENYSSFFVKRRPMMVAGAMNAMNVMMASGKNTLATTTTNAAAVAVPVQPSANILEHGPESVGLNTISTSTVAVPTTANVSTAADAESTGVGQDGGSVATGNQPIHGGPSSHNLLQTLSHSAGSHWRYQPCNLFKFDHSSQAISWNGFIQQQQQQQQPKRATDSAAAGNTNTDEANNNDKNGTVESADSKENNFVIMKESETPNNANNINSRLFDSLQAICGPNPDNLVVLYDILIQHVNKWPVDGADVASGGDRQPSIHNNTLHSYLVGSSEKFTLHINSQLDAMLEQAQKSLESGMTIVLGCNDPITSSNRDAIHQSCQSGHVLLQSAVMVDVAVQELNVLMMAMSDYGQHYLSCICNVFTTYQHTCKRLYKTITSESTGTSGQQASNLTANQSILALSSLDLTNGQQSLVGGEAGPFHQRSVLSADWARNEDINRLLKSQPNWIQLQFGQKSCHALARNHQPSPSASTFTVVNEASPKKHEPRMMINRQMSSCLSFDESPEVVRQRNAKEIDILINLMSQEITRSEMIWQEGHLTLLANMHQSFEWLSARCDYLVHLIQKQQQQQQQLSSVNGGSSSNVSDPKFEVYIATLNQLSKDFEEISQLCLLVLHLEVRVHCYYHLQALDAQFLTTGAPSTIGGQAEPQSSFGSGMARSGQHNNSSELSDDVRIVPLLEDLERMHKEISAAQLSPSKMSYLFEGLGHLMTTIFINAAMSVRRIKPNGIKRVCRAIYDIQRPLCTITKSRESALDYARQYFEMLLLNPEEILASIIERGRQFKEEEYVNAITLLHQSGLSQSATEPAIMQPNDLDQHHSNQQLQRLLKRLSDILAEVTA